jgi:hypothetical protein
LRDREPGVVLLRRRASCSLLLLVGSYRVVEESSSDPFGPGALLDPRKRREELEVVVSTSVSCRLPDELFGVGCEYLVDPFLRVPIEFKALSF